MERNGAQWWQRSVLNRYANGLGVVAPALGVLDVCERGRCVHITGQKESIITTAIVQDKSCYDR